MEQALPQAVALKNRERTKQNEHNRAGSIAPRVNGKSGAAWVLLGRFTLPLALQVPELSP